MDFERFLTGEGSDFLGRNLQDIWDFSDEEIEQTHDFVQVVFPINKPSRAVSHGFYLDSEALIEQIKNNPEAKENILKSAKWFLSFLARNTYWNQKYNHNQLRITRVIEINYLGHKNRTLPLLKPAQRILIYTKRSGRDHKLAKNESGKLSFI